MSQIPQLGTEPYSVTPLLLYSSAPCWFGVFKPNRCEFTFLNSLNSYSYHVDR
jgi:hypothetical protein